MGTFTVCIYTRGRLGFSDVQSLHWDEVDHFADWLEVLLQGPCIRVDVMEYEF